MIVNSDKFQAIYLFIHLFIYLFIYLFCLFIYLFIFLFFYLFIYLFIYSFVSEEIPAVSSIGKTGITIGDKLNFNVHI